ncbi:MAG TPA: flagellar motor protein [Solibacterales bacterium]|nr:flagellar motor protein [Bryobacterales bacterium]
MAAKRKGGRLRPDMASFLGLGVAVGGILFGQHLEGGHVEQLKGLSAALIVLGGTLGAVMVSTPLQTLLRGFVRLKDVFFERAQGHREMIEEIIEYATKARRSGIVSLENDAAAIDDPFLRKALNLAVDGTDLQELRKMMELEIGLEEHRTESEAKVYEAAGGYAPTIGIIGAVIGLILVMHDLADIKKVGEGIATAFVATIYGVGFANLFCLPAATKIKARAHAEAEAKELVLEGVIGIVEGLNPKIIRAKLESYLQEKPRGEQSGRTARAGAPAQARG